MTGRKTSAKVGKKASNALKDSKSRAREKSLAGSALSQRAPQSRGKKRRK